MSGRPATGDWRHAWTAALDALEADVAAVEAALTAEHRLRELPVTDRWSPPAGLGPMPLDLADRADAILARQLAAAAALAGAAATTRQHAAMVGRLAGLPGAPRPAYIDTSI